MLAQDLNNFHLLLVGKSSNGRLNHTADSCVVDSNKTRVVEECNGSHDELAVHAVSHTAMSRDGIAEVLDFECSLQPRGEEATEWCNERGKGS